MNSFRQSVFFKTALAILLFYSAYNISLYFYDAFSYLSVYRQRKTAFLLDMAHFSAAYLKQGDFSGLKEYLEDGTRAHYIDFYILGEKGHFQQKNTVLLPPEYLSKARPNELVQFSSVQLIRYLEGEKTVILGNYLSPKNYFRNIFVENKARLLSDALFVFLCFLGIVIYYFRDLIQLSYAFRFRDRSQLKKIKGISKESQLMLGALDGYEKLMKRSEGKNNILSLQILPALQCELDSGRKPPYNFPCAMARTDINQFSTIFNRFPREPFMELINRFFIDCGVIISSYSGLVHSYAGDEILYYFKEQAGMDPCMLAAGAIRDIHRLAEKIHKNAEKDLGYPFLVKSAIAYGELRFGKVVNGYSVAGAPFIETVRILSSITERRKNVLYYGENVAQRIRSLCDSNFEKNATLKGYDEEIALYSYVQHLEPSYSQEFLPLVCYRRSEEEILASLAHLRALASKEDFHSVIQSLRKMSYAGDKVEMEYRKILEEFQLSNPNDEDYQLSALLGLAKCFVGKENFSAFSPLLRSFLQCKDSRVLANALDLFAHFAPDIDLPELKKLRPAEDHHRLTASSIVKEALIKISDENVQKMEKMLADKSPLKVASALYALGEIAEYYRRVDPIYLSTRFRFIKLLHRLPLFIQFVDPMVSRQALRAAKKLSDESMLEELHILYQNTQSESLRKRFQDVFAWENSQNTKRAA